jgi:hypothetical protein
MDRPQNASDPYMDLEAAMEIALDDSKTRSFGGGKSYSVLPTHSFRIPVDSASLVQNNVLNADEMKQRVDALEFTLSGSNGKPKGYILKSQFAVLDMIRGNNWERPIYFAVTTGPDSYMGLQSFFRLEGLAYRLVPIRYPKNDNPNAYGGVATNTMYSNVMDNWSWGGMDNVEDGIYMDENNRRMVTNFRLQLSVLAEELMKENDPNRALDILEQVLVKMPEKNVPMSRVLMSIQGALMELASTTEAPGMKVYELSDDRRALARELGVDLTRRLFEIQADDLQYYHSLDPARFRSLAQERRIAKQVADVMVQTATLYLPQDSLGAELEAQMVALETMMAESEQRIATMGAFEF